MKEKSLERGEEGNINESLWQRRETKSTREKGIPAPKGSAGGMVADSLLDRRQRPCRKRWCVRKNSSREEKRNEGVCV